MKKICLLFFSLVSISLFSFKVSEFEKNLPAKTSEKENDSDSSVKILKTSEDSYSFFIIVNQQSQEDIEKKASKVAERLAQKHGFSHVIFRSKEKVQVIVGKTDWPNSYDFPQNLYEEKLVQRDIGSKRYNELPPPNYSLQNAYLYEIQLTNSP
jgi:hypothetical protein